MQRVAIEVMQRVALEVTQRVAAEVMQIRNLGIKAGTSLAKMASIGAVQQIACAIARCFEKSRHFPQKRIPPSSPCKQIMKTTR